MDAPERTGLSLREQMARRGRAGFRALRDFFFGFTVYELEVEMRRDRGSLENLFFLSVFGDLVGLPLLPPYYSLRLLPYMVPHLSRWKRSVLRERDLTDLASRDL